MSAVDPSVEQRLQDLARRVSELEAFRGRFEPTKSLDEPQRAPSEPIPSAAIEPRVEPVRVRIGARNIVRATPPTSPPTTSARTVRTLPADEEIDAFSIERSIGGRWGAAAGAVIVVIGIGLFLKLAYDYGWFGRLPAAAKCGAGASFGALLLAAGEVVRRRVNALGSVGLFAAGLGAMYASSYAAHAVYHLAGPAGTIALLSACVVLGIGIGALTNLAGVAAVSLVGAYLTPMLMHKSAAAAWFLPAYLVSLLAVALPLSAWKGRERPWFEVLRTMAWWGTMLLGGVWTLLRGESNWVIAIAFLATVWSSTHAERLVSASGASGLGRGEAAGRPLAAARLAAGSLSTTSWTVLLAAVVLESSGTGPMWWAAAVLCVASAGLASWSAGRRGLFRAAPGTPLEWLGATLLIQSGALLIATIGLAFSGWPRVAAGLALGLAAVTAGRRLNSRALDYYGVAVLAFASAMLAAMRPFAFEPAGVSLWHGLAASAWSYRAVLTGGAWLAAGALMLIRNPDATPVRAIACTSIGIVGLMVSFADPRTEPASLAVYWSMIGVGAALAGVVLPRLRLGAMGLVVLAASSAVIGWMITRGIAEPDVTHRSGLALTAWWRPAVILTTAWAVPAVLGARRPRGLVGPFAAGAGVALLCVAFLHPESSAASLTVYWSVIGLSCASASPFGRRLLLDCIGCGVLVIAMAAWTWAYPMLGWNRVDAVAALHPGLWLGIGLALAWLFAARLAADRSDDEESRGSVVGAGWAIAGLLTLAATSFEVARMASVVVSDAAVQRSAVSIYWGVFAAGLLVVGFARRIPLVRYAGLALLNVAAVKALIVDLAGSPPAWRVASFICLGLLMIGVAVGYARVAARLTPRIEGGRADGSAA